MKNYFHLENIIFHYIIIHYSNIWYTGTLLINICKKYLLETSQTELDNRASRLSWLNAMLLVNFLWSTSKSKRRTWQRRRKERTTRNNGASENGDARKRRVTELAQDKQKLETRAHLVAPKCHNYKNTQNQSTTKRSQKSLINSWLLSSCF